ncbi:MAG TPA: penicillin-binding transpeptidase domain-containing protein [Gemmatimonadaceae bacterium]
MPRPTRIVLVHASLVVFAIALMARAAQVQLWQHSQWVARAERQHFVSATLPAPRGNIYDVRGVPLAMSREMVRLSVAPREVANRRALSRALGTLGVSRSYIARATDTHRAWVTLPGSYLSEDAARVTSLRGVYTEPVVERVYTERKATRRVVGWMGSSGGTGESRGGGLELTLDSLLRGVDGSTTLARDSRGRKLAPPEDDEVAPIAGDAVTLTINQELQEISQRALAQAIERTRAEGGDIVIIDPHDGGIRAMASERVGDRTFGSPVVSEPFEPGSTVKPLFASSLLMRQLATPTDSVNTENGTYKLEGRTIRDEHEAPALSLADVIKYSSNIGIVKFVSRLSPREEFETLRDFGFGMPTGIAFPGEASGMLRAPATWSRQSAASLAMGYEVSVTPLQLAAAYAAVANGGELLQPAIVQEIRAPDGTVIYNHTRRVVRRVMTPEVAATVRKMMIGVMEGGTAHEAAMVNFTLAGKTGTARRVEPGHGYLPGAYTASFVGLFPAEKPEYVILVKVDGPRETIYGATAAAPVSKIVLEAAIASRDAALDRRSLTGGRPSLFDVADSTLDVAPATASTDENHDSAAGGSPPVVFDLQKGGLSTLHETATEGTRTVPDVHGLPLRAAVRELHRAGFRVRLSGFGTAGATSPAAGSLARPGALVRLVSAP